MDKKHKEKEKDTRSPSRFWIGAVGASALGLAIVFGVVMQMRAPRMAARAQPAARTQAAVRTAVKPPAAIKPDMPARPPASAKSEPRVALTETERKTSEALWVEQKKLETDAARAIAATPEARQRVTAAIAKEFKVPEKLVTDLRARKVAYGEITVALALARQLTQREKITPQKAVDRFLALRTQGQGWAAIAKRFGLKLGDTIAHVQTIDRQVARVDAGKTKATKG
jgi:ribosomal protein L3